MAYDDELDDEIDRDLGWNTGRTARLRRAVRDPITVRIARAWPMRVLTGLCRGVFKVVFFPVFKPASATKKWDINGDAITIKHTFLRRAFDSLMVRVVLIPIIAALFFLVLVWQTTHPKPVAASQTPATIGLFFKRVTLTCSDGQEVAAWCIPALSADQVVLQRDAVVGRRYPAIVLAHGLGFSHDQYLDLAQQFHKAGCTVLMVDTRGQGESPAASVTFGIRERFDLIAALDYCRAQPYTDETKLGLIGCGAAGAAALQVVAVDPSIGVVVADAVRPSFSDNLVDAMKNQWIPSRFLAVPYAAAFELVMREHLSALNLVTVVSSVHHAAILFVERPQSSDDSTFAQTAGLASNAGVAHRILTCTQRPLGDGQLLPQEAAHVVQFACENLHWDPQQPTADVVGLLKNQVR